jgi:multiphosphoryl transfer protein
MADQNHKSLEVVFSCPLASGLHARPASHLAEVANQYVSDCSLTNLRNGLVANAKSVLGIIAADVRHQDRCVLLVKGADERPAQKALHSFIHETLPHCDVPLVDTARSSHSYAIPRFLKAAGVTAIPGVPVSRGIAQGHVVILRTMGLPHKISSGPGILKPNQELDRVREAVASVRQQILEKLKYSLTPTANAVLQADLALASDVMLLEKLTERVLSGKSAAQAVVETAEYFIDLLAHSESEYIRQRSADIEEICVQLLQEICGEAPSARVELTGPSVLIAESLGPQQLLQLDRHWLRALVLGHSASTSHAAILARSLGIPTLAAVRNAPLLLSPGLEVVVDANRGFLIPQVSPKVRQFYEREQTVLQSRKAAWSRDLRISAITTDGKRVEVGANASSGEEAILAFENGADGIGLFRTEILFLGRNDSPSEEEQFAVYSEVVRTADGRPVIIRTFDIGGDKKAPYLNLPREENPFLGYRGMRIYAEHEPLLHTQLRSILRASSAGRLQIMAPMITTLEEVVQFKTAVTRAQGELAQEGFSVSPDIKIGIMIEVPAIAFVLDRLCREVDFFSIGTNDLSQYFFAADRTNQKVSTLFSVRHPGFLAFVAQIVERIHKNKKWVGLCGDMAADIRNLPLLVALGLDEISGPAAEVHELKRAVSMLHTADCAKMLARAIASERACEVDDLLAVPLAPQLEPLLSEELVVLESSSRTKEEVIQEIVDACYIAKRTEQRDLLEEALWAREELYSTGLGYGFATPHCMTDAITNDSICVLRLRHPIHWDSVDGEPVRMVVLLALRNSEAATPHMQIFSSLARKLMNEDFRQNLLEADSASAVTAYLAEQLGAAFVSNLSLKKSLSSGADLISQKPD